MFRNRWICLLLAAALLMTALVPAMAEDKEELEFALAGSEDTHVTVCNATKVNGAFFTRQFGNNTSDIDVRAMLHGYNPIVWDTQLSYITDPMVVDNMKVSKSGGNTVYSFKLHRDLTWNDGTRITAADYVFGYLLQASPEFEAIGGDTDVWQHVVGYEQYASGESEVFSGIRLLDKYSFSVTVKKEYLPYFYEYTYLYMMPSPISVIAPGCKVADDGRGAYITNEDAKADKPVFTEKLLKKTILDPNTGYLSFPKLTCGPYSLVSYDRASGKVEFEINPYFKGNYEGAKPTIHSVTLVHAFPQDMERLLENGDIDLINKTVDGKTINGLVELARRGGYSFENYPRLGYGYIGLACEQGPQQFTAVRQAIAYAFDTDDFVNTYLQGYGLPVYGYYGIGQWMTQAAVGSLRPAELTPAQAAMWDELTLDNLNTYAFDPDEALRLLIDDGWTLNAQGQPFDPSVDDVRYKKIGEDLMALSFEFGLTKDNEAAREVLTRLGKVMGPMGVRFVVHEEDFNDILIDYLREDGGKRKYDMSFLAYNFDSIFDPLVEMYADTDDTGSQNAPGVNDEELLSLCWDLHHTQPGDVLTFLRRWIAFQERFNEILPSVPLYSNVYFDFFIDAIQNYHPAGEANWPRALLYAFIGEPVRESGEDQLPGTEPEEDEGETIVIG